jgi:AraC-like DNA-binding protein
VSARLCWRQSPGSLDRASGRSSDESRPRAGATEILRETREALARPYLEKTALPAAEISFLLGFDEPNSFYRAFRMWTGMTPDSVRYVQRGSIARIDSPGSFDVWTAPGWQELRTSHRRSPGCAGAAAEV